MNPRLLASLRFLEGTMVATNSNSRKLVWRFFILLVLSVGVVFLVGRSRATAQSPPDCSGQFSTCQSTCEISPGVYLSGCIDQCVSDREGCVGSGGTDSGCEGLFSACGFGSSDASAGACY